MRTFSKPPKSLISCVGKAIADYDMIRARDRILLGLSGGKDSLSLLHLLLYFQPVIIAFTAVFSTMCPHSF